MMGHKVVGSRQVMEEHPDFYLGMGLTAENVATEYGISRADQDSFALTSHQRAVQAISSGAFVDKIIPIKVSFRTPGQPHTKVNTVDFDQDEGPRADTSLEALARLKPAFKQGGSVTAGNSSQMSDGVGMCLVASEEFVQRHEMTLKPLKANGHCIIPPMSLEVNARMV